MRYPVEKYFWSSCLRRELKIKKTSTFYAPALCSIIGAESRQILVLRPFKWEIKDDAYLNSQILYPKTIFRFIQPVYVHLKTDRGLKKKPIIFLHIFVTLIIMVFQDPINLPCCHCIFWRLSGMLKFGLNSPIFFKISYLLISSKSTSSRYCSSWTISKALSYPNCRPINNLGLEMWCPDTWISGYLDIQAILAINYPDTKKVEISKYPSIHFSGNLDK